MKLFILPIVFSLYFLSLMAYASPSKPKVVLIGGAGDVGSVIAPGLSDDYEVIVADIKPKPENFLGNYISVDASNYDDLKAKIPGDTFALVNLIKLFHNFPHKKVDAARIKKMANIYVVGTYNIFLLADELKIKKVVFASSNHVTGQYEKNGDSLLGRPITTSDYPRAGNPYGAMKIFGEQVGDIFSSENKEMSVINLRIATVRADDVAHVTNNLRARKTILSVKDTINVFKKSLETKLRYGIFYAVSDNPNRPWSIENTVIDLGFEPSTNSEDLLKKDLDKKQTIRWVRKCSENCAL